MEVKRWQIGTAVAAGGSLSLFLFFRFQLRVKVEDAILKYYNQNKLVIGPLLYFSQTGSFKVAVEGHKIRKLAKSIAKREVPIFSFSMPDKKQIIEEIANDSLAKASENKQIKRLADQALQALK